MDTQGAIAANRKRRGSFIPGFQATRGEWLDSMAIAPEDWNMGGGGYPEKVVDMYNTKYVDRQEPLKQSSTDTEVLLKSLEMVKAVDRQKINGDTNNRAWHVFGL